MDLTKHESTISSDLFVQILVHTLLHISTIYQASTKPKPTPRIYRILKLYKTHMYHDMWYDTMTNVAQVSFHPALNVLITFYPYRYLIPKSPTNSTHLPFWIGCLSTQKKHQPQTSSCPLGFPHVRPIGFQRGIEFGVGGNHLKSSSRKLVRRSGNSAGAILTVGDQTMDVTSCFYGGRWKKHVDLNMNHKTSDTSDWCVSVYNIKCIFNMFRTYMIGWFLWPTCTGNIYRYHTVDVT